MALVINQSKYLVQCDGCSGPCWTDCIRYYNFCTYACKVEYNARSADRFARGMTARKCNFCSNMYMPGMNARRADEYFCNIACYYAWVMCGVHSCDDRAPVCHEIGMAVDASCPQLFLPTVPPHLM